MYQRNTIKKPHLAETLKSLRHVIKEGKCSEVSCTKCIEDPEIRNFLGIACCPSLSCNRNDCSFSAGLCNSCKFHLRGYEQRLDNLNRSLGAAEPVKRRAVGDD